MKRTLVIFLVFLMSLSLVYSAQREEPYTDFTLLKCDDFGVLSFKADYQPNDYKGDYNVYLPSVKVNTTLDGKTLRLNGQWYRFDTKQFLTTEIKMNVPIAYFFSDQDSLKKGNYEIIIDYAVSNSGYELFKKQFLGIVSCPTTRYELEKEMEVLPQKQVKEEVVVETTPIVNKPSAAEQPNYNIFYITGIIIASVILLIMIFSVGLSLARKINKATNARRKASPKDVERLFEKRG